MLVYYLASKYIPLILLLLTITVTNYIYNYHLSITITNYIDNNLTIYFLVGGVFTLIKIHPQTITITITNNLIANTELFTVRHKSKGVFNQPPIRA